MNSALPFLPLYPNPQLKAPHISPASAPRTASSRGARTARVRPAGSPGTAEFPQLPLQVLTHDLGVLASSSFSRCRLWELNTALLCSYDSCPLDTKLLEWLRGSARRPILNSTPWPNQDVTGV